ncbi:MAG TPA: hypothetical protein VIF83_14155 [Gemmatimonadaceae bacterium]|jgi:hypothetical protein
MNRILILFVSALSLMCKSATADHKDDRATALALIRRTSAAQLEAGLPSQPISDWLGRVFDTTVNWDTEPGCGKPRGADNDRLCAATTIPFNRDLRATVLIDVGRVGQVTGPPKFDFAFWERSDGTHFTEVKRLSDLAKVVIATKN